MPCWYYDKKDLKNTLSIRDGLDYETERRYRKEGARFIMQCGTEMALGHNTIATGIVYFHRFYMFHSFKTFPRYVSACCCLFLAGKVEETPKKCMDIIKTARTLLSDIKFKSFGVDPKEEVMILERILLKTIKFDLQVEHPYGYLLKYAKCLKGDKGKLQKMVQMAWNFVNDSLSTTVCLQWEPEIIAVALIHLASKLSKFIVDDWTGREPSHLRWWDMFVADVTMEILEDICHQVLDLYQQSQTTGMDSPPQLPVSKASPPAAKRPLMASPKVKKVAPSNPVMPVRQATATITSATKIRVQENTLDNQPIPKLITVGDNMHYAYPQFSGMYHIAQHYGIMPPQPPPGMPPPIYPSTSQYPQSMPPPLQTSTLAHFQHGAHTQQPPPNYYRPPPTSNRMPGYYRGPP